jgi:chromosome segregation ATPase
MTEQEQNKKINELDRRMTRVEEQIKSVNLDLEPDGRITEAFDYMESSMDSQFLRVQEEFKQVRKNQDRIRHELSDIRGGIEAILQRLTKVDDLPEE